MDNRALQDEFFDLTTPCIADACLRHRVAVRAGPPSLRPLVPRHRLAGRVLPVKHYGSVDIFLEAMTSAQAGDVLVIDNEGRMDEACIGDLTALEVRASALAGIVTWGCHRDTAELLEIGLPIFSLGAFPFGPRRNDPREPNALRSADVHGIAVTDADVVFADADGVLFAPLESVAEIVATARAIRQTERRQADRVRAGVKLRDQLRFDDYLAQRALDPALSFRQHLRRIGGEIEE